MKTAGLKTCFNANVGTTNYKLGRLRSPNWIVNDSKSHSNEFGHDYITIKWRLEFFRWNHIVSYQSLFNQIQSIFIEFDQLSIKFDQLSIKIWLKCWLKDWKWLKLIVKVKINCLFDRFQLNLIYFWSLLIDFELFDQIRIWIDQICRDD